MKPGATSQSQSSSGRNKSQAANSSSDHTQQPVATQGVMSNSLPAESAHKSSEGSSLLTQSKSLPQQAQQGTVIDFTLEGTELARVQGRLKTQHAQHASAPQHAERGQRSQCAELSAHADFTATVSMTARCRHQSPESCNSNSGIVSQCAATMHHSEVNSSLSVHASLSPRKVSKAAKHGRQGQVPKQSVLLTDQRDSMPAQLQLQEQLPQQSSIMMGQCDCMPAQLQLREQLLNDPFLTTGQHETRSAQLRLQEQPATCTSPDAAPCPSSASAGLQELPLITTQSPQPVTSHNLKQPVSKIVSSKVLSQASSIVAAQQVVSRSSSSTVRAEAHSLQASQSEVAQGAGRTQPQQQAEADSCSAPAPPAQPPEPVCSERTASSLRQTFSTAAAGREPVERKPSLPAVWCKTSSETLPTSQVRARHDGQPGNAQHPAPDAQPVTLSRSCSASSARRGAQLESCASQPQLAPLSGSGSASKARRKMHAESTAPQPQPAALPHNDSASNAQHGVPVRSTAPRLQLAAVSGSHSTSSAQHAHMTASQPQLAAVSGSAGTSSANHGIHSMASCQLQPQLQQQTVPDAPREGSRQQAVPSTAGTMLRQQMHSGSRSSSMHVNVQSDLGVQQEVSQPDCFSSSRRTSSQSSYASQQDALQPVRCSRHKLLQPSCSSQQEVSQPDDNGCHGPPKAEGLRAESLALLQEQSQLALATQGSCSDLSREGLEEDNCRLRRALAAIEQQLGMIRNQQVT